MSSEVCPYCCKWDAGEEPNVCPHEWHEDRCPEPGPTPATTTRHDYTVCDGQCVPDECVCPSAAQRSAEIHAAVAAERARFRAGVEALRAQMVQKRDNAFGDPEPYYQRVAALDALEDVLALIDGGETRGADDA